MKETSYLLITGGHSPLSMPDEEAGRGGAGQRRTLCSAKTLSSTGALSLSSPSHPFLSRSFSKPRSVCYLLIPVIHFSPFLLSPFRYLQSFIFTSLIIHLPLLPSSSLFHSLPLIHSHSPPSPHSPFLSSPISNFSLHSAPPSLTPSLPPLPLLPPCQPPFLK